MKITCKHPASSYGVPVILDEAGQVMDYAPGLNAVLSKLGWSRAEFAERCGYKVRSVEKFWQGAPPSASALNVLALALEAHQ